VNWREKTATTDWKKEKGGGNYAGNSYTNGEEKRTVNCPPRTPRPSQAIRDLVDQERAKRRGGGSFDQEEERGKTSKNKNTPHIFVPEENPAKYANRKRKWENNPGAVSPGCHNFEDCPLPEKGQDRGETSDLVLRGRRGVPS